MATSATSSRNAAELRRLQTLLPPELRSWVSIEVASAVNPPLITCEEIGKDEAAIMIDFGRWERLATDQRNLLFWHEVARIQNDAIPKDGWEMAALAIGLGGVVGELWVQDGLLLLLALALSGFAGYRLYQRNNSDKRLNEAIEADEKAIALAVRFGYTVPTAYKSLGSALKTLLDLSTKDRQKRRYEARLQSLRLSAAKAKARMKSMRESVN
ncbi:DUF3318 domain-containing protein [Leptolyngbya sp. FACHB-261]|uniref:DUF3318 domain-containing protein n=1 Tax=Leptolyngbya sp. FACHB-261 TaxID=2692806 RepID=UPI001683ACDD|nr:DUF3318 domain-containing protein [Leptolyngbya sp. FACHB-261]MBD2101291.1 DUF3318 domain-containing protein [Leptolyngbya sp. FACHB-261]